MDSVDSRTRGKISLQSTESVNSSSVLPRRLLADVLLVLALNAGKDYLLSEVGVFWVLVRVLACGGLSVMVWLATSGHFHTKHVTEWSAMGMSSLLLFMRHASMFTALYRLPSTRAILFTHFSPFWLRSLATFTSVSDPIAGLLSQQLLTGNQLKQALAVLLALLLSIIWDARFSFTHIADYIPGYGALIIEALSAVALEHIQSVLSPTQGNSEASAIGLLGACVFSLPLYMLRHVLLGDTDHHIPSLASLAVLPCMAYIVLHFEPKASVSSNIAITSPRYVTLSYVTTFSAAIVLGYLGFGHVPELVDFVVPALLLYSVYPKPVQQSRGATPYYATTSRLMRAYLKDILSNPESRKIFYFLMLNMCYMLVQMLYGIWTNSLGLISDAIHMAFDCMAIAVGLIASVMARWPPNERFTYGYGRIETLSGFANGIFLILISVFIVFEAIQRLLDPPEMNTSQLLLVSSLGLGVNLFGMFAMGGHHHGGHTHSHSHAHSHASAVPLTPVHSIHDLGDHSHDLLHTDLGHDHGHMHDHDHSHDHHHSHGHHPHPSAQTPEHHSPPLSSLTEHGYSHSASYIPSEPHPHSHSIIPSAHGHSHSINHTKDVHTAITSSRTGVQSHHQSLQIKTETPTHLHLHPAHARLQGENITSPITPNYKFGHDDHFEIHHSSGHAPNLHDHSHVHDHAHEGRSDNMRGVFLHVMADTLGSVGVIVSTLLIQLYGWTGFDPIASLFIAVLIAASVIPLVIDTGKVLALDIGAKDQSVRDALTELTPIEGLESYSAPRFWPKDSSSTIGTIHIQLTRSASVDPGGPHSNAHATVTRVDKVVERVDKLLRSHVPGLEELTIQVEDSVSHYAD